MKTIFTKSYFNKTLKSLLAFCVVLLMSINAFAQVTATEDFENETVASGVFSEGSPTINFNTTFPIVSYAGNFGYDNSPKFLEIKRSVNATNTATISINQITNPGIGFRINSFAAFTSGGNSGVPAINGIVTVSGTPLGGGAAVTVDIPVGSASGVLPSGQSRETNGMVDGLTLGSAFNGLFFTTLTFSITDNDIGSPTIGTSYLGVDHINFTTQAPVTNNYTIGNISYTEGDAGSVTYAYTVNRSITTAAGSVQIQSGGGSATAGTDYVAVPLTTVSFAANGASSQTVNVTINGDATIEPNETFNMTLSNPIGGTISAGTGVVTIVDDDLYVETFEDETDNTAVFSQNSVNFISTGRLKVRQSSPFGSGGSAKFLTTPVGGPFVSGDAGSIQINTLGKTFNIISIDLWISDSDINAPNNGTVTITGTKADGSGTISTSVALNLTGFNYQTVNFGGAPFNNVQLTSISFSLPSGITHLQLDNFNYAVTNLAGTQLSINDASVIEGTGAGANSTTFTVTRSNNSSAFAVNVASSDGTATAGSDYTTTSTTLNFTAGGGLTQTVTVPILKDAITEVNETFNMTLSNPTNGALILDPVGIGTIIDDDGITETYEDETNGSKSFTESGASFTATGDWVVRNSTGSNNSNFRFDTGVNNGGSTGNVGTISITTPNKAFRLIGFDGWTSNNDGINFATGVVTIKGNKFGGGSVQTNKTITPTSDASSGWQQNIGFTATPIAGELFTSIEMIIVSGINYIAIDNFKFELVDLSPVIEVVDASNVAITNGGAAGTANNTDFGLRCLTGATQSKTYTIKNLGQTDLTLSGSPLAVLGGTDASQFSITTQPTSPIAPGASVTFTVLFDPNVGGAKVATVTLTSNDASASPYVINIKGIGGSEPTATIGTIPAICAGATSFTIPFSGASANPTAYSVSGTGGITTVINRTPPNSPMIVSLSSPAVFGTNPSFTFSLINGNGCVSPNYTGSVTVNEGPTLTKSASPAICAGATSFTIPYTATTGTPTTYSISGTDITTVTDAALPATPITVNLSSGATGTSISYTLTVKNAAGCTSSNITGSVTVNTNPTASPSSNTPVCVGNTLNLTSTIATSYLWTGPNSFSGTVQNPSISNVSIVAGNTYTLRVTNASGCTATATTAVVINSTPAPTAPTATPSNRTTAGSVTLSATGCVGGTITWFNAADNVAVPSPNNQPNFTSSGTFNFYAKCTGTNTCVSNASVNVPVTVLLCTPLGASPGNVNITWTGLESTDWNTACNWSPAWVPDATNNQVIIAPTSNQPIINGTTTATIKVMYLDPGATLTINNSGALNVRGNSGTDAGITVRGTLNNNGSVRLETAAAGALSQTEIALNENGTITNNGSILVNNNTGGIDLRVNTATNALTNSSTGTITFTNCNTGIRFIGTGNRNILNNGTISFSGVGLALSNSGTGTLNFTNTGLFTINTGTGIQNDAGKTINNNTCGRIIMAVGNYTNAGTTTNAGLIQMPNAFTSTGTFNNNGVLKSNTGVLGVTNNKMLISNTCPIFTLGGSNNYTVSGIFTDAAATTSAGTYTSVGNKFTANNTIPTGTQTLYAQVTDIPAEGFCTFVVPFVFDNVKPTSVSVNNTTVCTGGSVTLSATCASGTPTWYTTATGGSNIGTGASLSNSPTVATTYYAACETTNCVSGRVATSAVSIATLPTASASSNSPICAGTTLNLSSGSEGNTYLWIGPSSFTSTELSPSIANATVSATGTYTITITNSNNCTSTVTVAVTVNAVPTATGSSNSPICVGNSISLTGGGVGSYLWTGPNGYSSIAQSPTITNATVSATGTYTITVTGTGSCTSTATVAVTVNALPTATASSNSPICAGATLNLTGGGVGTSYAWTSSNGFTSTDQSPTIANATVSSSGTYTITVTNAGGCTSTASVAVTVNALPTATASSNSPICAGLTLQLTGTGGGAYLWTAPGNAGTSAQANPFIPNAQPSNSGTYTLRVTNTITGCSVTVSTLATVNARPTATASSNSPICAGTTLNLTGGGVGTSYAWTSSNGFTSTAQSPTISNATVSSTGTYTITVTNSDGCTSTASVAVTINATPTATASTNTPIICAGNNIALTGGGVGTYAWAGPNGFTSTAQSPTISNASVSATGTYTITVTNVSGCTSTATVAVTVNANPTATASSNSPICAGATLNLTSGGGGSYAWTGPAIHPMISTTQNPTISNVSVAATGVYTVMVTNNGCTSTATIAVIVNATPTATASTNTPIICAGNNIALTGGGVGTYSWAGPNGFASTEQSPTITNATVLATGTYTITVANVSNCTSTATVAVTVNAVPTATASSNSPVCAGNTLNLTGGGVGTYSWTSSNGFTSTAQNPTIPNATVSSTGTYTITVTNASGCTSTASVAVTVNANPTATASSNSPICAGNTLNLTGGGIGTYSWTGVNGFNSTDQNPTIPNATILASGTYQITVTNVNGCTSTATTSVMVNPNPVATASNNSPVCAGTTLNLTGGGVGTYLWTGPNGYSSTSQSPTISSPTVLASGVYRITVTNANSCTSTATTSVTVNPLPVVDAGANQTICEGSTASLTATCNLLTVSTILSGASEVPANASTATGTVSGTFDKVTKQLLLTISFNGLTANASAAHIHKAAVGVNGGVIIGFSGVPAATSGSFTYSGTLTAGQETDLLAGLYYVNVHNATFPGGEIRGQLSTACVVNNFVWNPGNLSGQTVTVSPSTTQLYTVTASNTTTGCSSTATTTVNVNPRPVPTIGSNTPVCVGNTLNLTSGGGTSYAWTGPNTFTSTDQNPSIASVTVSASGTYTVTVTNVNGCTNTATTAVVINALPTATASNNSPICSGVTLNLTGGGVGTYAWAGPNGYTSTDQSPSIPSATASMSGTYTITVTNANGCTSIATTSITVNPVVTIPTPQANTQIIFGASITLTATGCSGVNDVLKWYQSADNVLVTMPVSPTATTNYYAKCENTLNGITCISGNSVDVTVTVLQPTPPVATGATNCLGTPTTLTATGCSGSVGTFVLKWYQNADDALVTMPVSPLASTDYYAKCEQTFNSVTAISAKSNVVSLTILNPPTPVSTGGTIYVGQSISLTATGCTGTLGTFTLKWYQTSDNLLVTMPVSPTVTTQYYAKCEQTVNSITCLSPKSNDVSVTVVNRIFVDIAKITAPIQNGNSWATAYGNLQTGLAAATAGVEVWVAKGTYKPTNTITRTIYFNIPNSVKVYGGFAGTEDLLSQRILAPLSGAGGASILSGDIGTQKLAADNSYHVVVMNGSSISTVLDGFTISDGYANFDPNRTYLAPNELAPTTGTIETGGGILVQNAGMPTIANCMIINNAAVTGGGLYAGDASMPTIMFCKIMANQAGFGSGMYFQDGSNGKIDNTLISGNRGVGGIYNNNSSPIITNVTFAGNGGYNGGIFNSNSQPVVKNSIIWGNSTPFNDTQSIITYSTIQGGYPGTGNLSINPKFVNQTPEGLSPNITGDYHVQASSLAIDRGDNGAISLTDKDLDGNLRRFAGGRVDMGTYEFQGTATANLVISSQSGNWEINSTWVGFKVPTLGDYVIIDNNHIVILNGTGIAKNLEYRGTGQLKFNTTTSKLEIGF